MKAQFARHKITFEDSQDIEAVALAQLGFSNKFIQSCTPLTEHQINYRLTKGKTAEGLPKGQGYRSQFRNGTSAMARSIMEEMLPGIRRNVRKELPKHFVKPTAEVVKKAA